jgi:small subunit ribosomal protein S9
MQPKCRPQTQSFFTARASFHELLVRFERLEDLADIDAAVDGSGKGGGAALGGALAGLSWLKKEEFEAITDDVLTIAEYRELIQQLNRLRAHPHGRAIEKDLVAFARPGEQRVEKAATAELVDGGITTVGRRKNSTAFVELRPWLSPLAVANQKWYGVQVPAHLDGIIVNGVPLATYFSREMDMYEVLRPLEMVNGVGKFQIEARVRSGGVKGQAGAIRLAIARALVQLHPELRPALKAAKMLRRDPRMVERKKPGQKKARKKFQWVKR